MQPNRLDAIGMLDCLDERSKGELEKRCRWRRFKAGERIVERNSGDSDVYFVAEGAVRVVNHSMTGREIALARLQRGGYFGEISAIDGLLRSASVVALEDCLLASLAPRIFIDTLIKHPAMAIQVLSCLADIIRGCDERIMDLSTLGAVERVFRQLLRLAEESPVNPGQWLIPALPTHKVIAAMASTTRETVARNMSQLAKAGIVERKGRVLFIRDREQLENLTGVLEVEPPR
jgi:CRP-like cAMP-binding protein